MGVELPPLPQPFAPQIGLNDFFTADQMRAYATLHASNLRGEVERLRALLNEVRCQFTRDDDLPDDLLPRIDAALKDET